MSTFITILRRSRGLIRIIGPLVPILIDIGGRVVGE